MECNIRCDVMMQRINGTINGEMRKSKPDLPFVERQKQKKYWLSAVKCLNLECSKLLNHYSMIEEEVETTDETGRLLPEDFMQSYFQDLLKLQLKIWPEKMNINQEPGRNSSKSLKTEFGMTTL